MGQLPEDAPIKAAHSSRNRARRMKAARTEARRLVGEAMHQRDLALAELSAAKDELSDARRKHELECADLTRKINETAAQRDDAAERAKGLADVLSDRDSLAERYSLLFGESEMIKQSLLEALDSLEGEREKSQGLLERLAELSGEIESERGEKEEFRQEVIGLRSKIENLSGLSNDEVNGLVARAQAAEERAGELSQSMTTLQNQAEDYERQLKAAKDDYERLMRVTREERKKRKSELDEIYDLHEGELETNRGLVKDNAALTDSVAKVKAELETVSAERNELRKALDSKQLELDRAINDSHKDDFERLRAEVSSERERADRAEGKARAADLLRDELASMRSELAELHRQLADCSTLREDLEDAEAKLADHMARASDAEAKARAAERDSARLSRELERVNMKLAEESSRADGADAALRDADGVKSLALPHGLLPGEETTVALGSGFQKFRVQKIVYRADGTICVENERGQSVPMGTWH